MSDRDIEQKLELVQQIRNRYQSDKSDMGRRESIFYGKQDYGDYGGEYQPVSTFRLRLLFAVVMLTLFVFVDENNIKVAGITTEKIVSVISADYEEQLEHFVDAISDKLKLNEDNDSQIEDVQTSDLQAL